jgi:5'-3' exonuclease
MGILDMLLSFEIEVYLVFDGKNLPAKERTEVDRAASRSKNMELGHAEKKKGNAAGARALMAKAVDVSPRMAAQFIQVVRRHRPQVKYGETTAHTQLLCAHACNRQTSHADDSVSDTAV